MKIETRKRMVEVPYEIHIATDGKEFESKKECLEYEKNKRIEIKNYWDNYIYKFEVEPHSLGYSYDSEDYYDYIMVLKNMSDIQMINEMMKWFGNVWYHTEFTSNDIGKKFIAVLEYSNDIMDGNDIYFIDYDKLWETISSTHDKIMQVIK